MRFSIRDMLWLTLVVGLAVGWWVDRRGLARDRNKSAAMYRFERAKAEEWETHATRLQGALERSGLVLNHKGWVVRVQPFDPALYPPLE